MNQCSVDCDAGLKMIFTYELVLDISDVLGIFFNFPPPPPHGHMQRRIALPPQSRLHLQRDFPLGIDFPQTSVPRHLGGEKIPKTFEISNTKPYPKIIFRPASHLTGTSIRTIARLVGDAILSCGGGGAVKEYRL